MIQRVLHFFTKPRLYFLLSFIFGFLALIAIFSDLFGEVFLPDFISNTLATFLGVIMGIPVALWLSSYQKRRTTVEKKYKILNLLKVELELNRSELVAWKSRESGDLEAGTLGVKLSDESWRAFSEGGELEWIKDPSLLFALSNVYYEIGVIKNLSEKYYNVSIIGSRKISQPIVVNHLDLLKQAVVNAINTINNTLKNM